MTLPTSQRAPLCYIHVMSVGVRRVTSSGLSGSLLCVEVWENLNGNKYICVREREIERKSLCLCVCVCVCVCGGGCVWVCVCRYTGPKRGVNMFLLVQGIRKTRTTD